MGFQKNGIPERQSDLEPLREVPLKVDRGASIDGILAKIDDELATRRNLIAECEREIVALTKARTLITESLLSRKSAPARPEGVVARSRGANLTRGPHETSLAERVRRATRELLRREGRPLNRVEILDHLLRSGFEFAASDPAKRVGKIIWASGEYQHVGSGYWFKGEQLPS